MFEFNIISKNQIKGDMIIFDDYNHEKFPSIVKAIKYIESKKNYDISLVQNKNTHRDYVIAKKIN